MNIQQLFDMGGYGLYVWPAYGITLFVFGINLFLALYEKRQAKKMIAQFNNHHES